MVVLLVNIEEYKDTQDSYTESITEKEVPTILPAFQQYHHMSFVLFLDSFHYHTSYGLSD